MPAASTSTSEASHRRLSDTDRGLVEEPSAETVQTLFTNSGLKEFEAFAVDGRHTLAELNRAIKNIDEHPSRLIFGH